MFQLWEHHWRMRFLNYLQHCIYPPHQPQLGHDPSQDYQHLLSCPTTISGDEVQSHTAQGWLRRLQRLRWGTRLWRRWRTSLTGTPTRWTWWTRSRRVRGEVRHQPRSRSEEDQGRLSRTDLKSIQQMKMLCNSENFDYLTSHLVYYQCLHLNELSKKQHELY